MKNYTTQTASLKATTIDTRLLDAKQIDTNKLFINGTQFVPSPNNALFPLMIVPGDEGNAYFLQSMKTDQDGECIFESRGYLQKGSETNGVLSNGVYAVIQINDNFAKCIGGNSLNNVDSLWINNIPFAKFEILNISSSRAEQCILENFVTVDTDNVSSYWFIKICEEDDNSSELYGGITEEIPYFMFFVSIPYYIPENDTSSSTYSLRKTNPFDSLREKIEEMRQQMLDNPTNQ